MVKGDNLPLAGHIAENRPAPLDGAPAAARRRFSYRYYVLFSVLVVSIFNFVDRILVGILAEPISTEFHLSDFQLGLLGGPAFALLYVIMGFPFARLSERTNRSSLISAVFIAWSVMTALCGVATSFLQLLLARVGVSVGEAGASPASQSLICDYFPEKERGTAFGVFSLGVPLGNIVAAIGGGWLAYTLGWRSAFIWLGVVGVLLSVVFRLSVRDPRPAIKNTGSADIPDLKSTIAHLAAKATFRWVVLGNTIAVMFGFSIQTYAVLFLMRRHGLELPDAALILALMFGVAGGVSAFFGGTISDWVSKRSAHGRAIVPQIGFAIAAPLFVIGFLSPIAWLAIVALVLGSLFHLAYLGVGYAMIHSIAEARMRATAIAILLFFVNLIGAGLGPPIIGMMSDSFTGSIQSGLLGSTGACQLLSGCGEGAGLALALCAASLLNILAAFLFWRAGRNLRSDMLVEES